MGDCPEENRRSNMRFLQFLEKTCCLPGTRVKASYPATALRLLSRVIFFSIGSDQVATRNLKRDFWPLGQLIKGLGAQEVLSCNLPASGNDEGGNRESPEIHTWLQACCHCQNFNCGLVYRTDRAHLS